MPLRRRNELFRFRGTLHGVPLPLPRLRETKGPLRYFNPTSAYFQNTQTDSFEHLAKTQRPISTSVSNPYQISYFWTSRNNRKGHHAMVISSPYSDLDSLVPLEAFSKRRRVYCNMVRMATHFPFWDISYVIAILFVVGSLIWIVDGLVTFLPEYGTTGASSAGEISVSQAPAFAFVGVNFFFAANIMQMLETLNELQRQCFSWKSEAAQQSEEEKGSAILRPGDCQHHHANKNNLIGKSPDDQLFANKSTLGGSGKRSWRWIPSYSELRLHYAYDLGFLACLIQLASAVIFYFGAITRLPGIYNHLSTALAYVLVWVPKSLGSLGFVISGFIFMIETQQKWWIPSPDVLGWHAGVWTIVGGIAFVISSCLGMASSTWAEYQSALTLLWGSFAFIIVSVIQWYECLEKYSVRLEVARKSESTGHGMDPEARKQSQHTLSRDGSPLD